VHIAPGRVEIRPQPSAPRDLAAQLTALLAERTGARWTVTVSNEPGEPTLAEQGRSAETDRRATARSHPLVQAILAAFPGATIEAVRDAGADDYGLPLTPAAATAEPDDMDGRDFAPPEAGTAWSDDDPPTDD
jgi:DNA polymerase-3 subunit gamma/tau